MGRSCRLTGAATFSGLGIYALRQAQLQGTFQKVRPKGGSIIGGQVTAAIGIGEFEEFLGHDFGSSRKYIDGHSMESQAMSGLCRWCSWEPRETEGG